MHKNIPIVTLGFVAVMLLIGTHVAWNCVVLILLYSVNSSEYCKEKCVFMEEVLLLARSSVYSFVVMVMIEKYKYYKQLTTPDGIDKS